VGYGEIAPLPGWGGETEEDVNDALKSLSSKLIDELIPTEIHGISDLLLSFDSILSTAPATRCGIEMALLDLIGKSIDKPLAALLNPEYINSSPVAALIGLSTDEDNFAQVHKFMDYGFHTYKIKTKRSAHRTVDSLKAINEKFNKKFNYRVDTNGQWSLQVCEEFIDKSNCLNIEYLEQPLPKGKEKEMMELTKQSGFPIALDESVGTLDEARSFLNMPELIQIIKPMTIGGIIPAYDHIHKARAAGAKCVISSAMDSSLACSYYLTLSAALQSDLAIGIGNCLLLENDILAEPLKFKNGTVSLLSNPKVRNQLIDGLKDQMLK